MKHVEIYQLQNDGSQTVLATCKLIDGTVIIKGDRKFGEYVTNEGIRDYSGEGKLFPKDGLSFLEQLKYNFKSGYTNASDIQESEKERRVDELENKPIV